MTKRNRPGNTNIVFDLFSAFSRFKSPWQVLGLIALVAIFAAPSAISAIWTPDQPSAVALLIQRGGIVGACASMVILLARAFVTMIGPLVGDPLAGWMRFVLALSLIVAMTTLAILVIRGTLPVDQPPDGPAADAVVDQPPDGPAADAVVDLRRCKALENVREQFVIAVQTSVERAQTRESDDDQKRRASNDIMKAETSFWVTFEAFLSEYRGEGVLFEVDGELRATVVSELDLIRMQIDSDRRGESADWEAVKRLILSVDGATRNLCQRLEVQVAKFRSTSEEG